MPSLEDIITVDGKALGYREAMAVANFTDLQLTDNVAVMMEEMGHKLTGGPVAGWRVEPIDKDHPGSYALRLD